MTIQQIIKNNRFVFFVLILCFLVLSSHTFYILQTRQYPQMDEQHYMDMAVQFFRLLQNPTLDTPRQMIEYIPFRQPGYSLLILPFLMVFGIEHSYQIALFVNGLLYTITIISTYFLAKEFLGKTAGLLSAFLFATFGWSLFYLHFTYSETATTSFVVLTLLFLVKSNRFQHTLYSLLFGIFFGYGMLTRWVTPIFIAGPLLYTLYSLTRSVKNKKIALRNLFSAALVSIIIAIYPYAFNIAGFWGSYVKEQLFGGSLWSIVPAERKSHVSLQSAAYYFKVFEQLTIYLFLTFSAGLLYIIVRIKQHVFLLFAFLFPYTAFSFFTIIKDDRYIVPIYPVIAIITAIAINAIPNSRLRFIYTIVIITICIYNFFGASWGIGPLGKTGLQSVLIPMPVGHPRRIHFTTIVWPPVKEYANAQVIMDTLDADIQKRKLQNPYILQLFGYQPVDNALYALNRYTKIKPYTFDNFIAADVNSLPDVEKRLKISFQKADYLFIKTGSTSDNYFPAHNYALLQAMNAVFPVTGDSVTGLFEKIGIVQVPIDSSTVTIYRSTGLSKKSVPDEFVNMTVKQLLKDNNL